MQSQVVILRGVLKVKFTKYRTCAAENPGEGKQLSRDRQGFSSISKLEPYHAGGMFREKLKGNNNISKFENMKIRK